VRHWERLKFAAVLTVIGILILSLIEMVFSTHIEDLIISPELNIPMFVVSYLLAPVIAKFIKYK
jgi:hypothetical protein